MIGAFDVLPVKQKLLVTSEELLSATAARRRGAHDSAAIRQYLQRSRVDDHQIVVCLSAV
jgi:hypothetical protein